MTVDKVIAKIIWLTFFWPTLYIRDRMLRSAQNVSPSCAILSTTIGGIMIIYDMIITTSKT